MARARPRWLLALGCCLVTVHSPAREASDPGASVVKIVADTRTGADMFGSAVVIAPGKIATNCHVVRDANTIHVEVDGRRWPAQLYAGDGERDLCLLHAPGLPQPPALMRSTLEVSPGETATAIGYPDGGKRVDSQGRIESLHRFQDARVIRVSAQFEPGASGGGLFTATGELIGILTFKAPRGDSFYFAIPIDWVLGVEEARDGLKSPSDTAFWDRVPAEREHFLRASWFNAQEDWPALYEVCERWIGAEPENEEARLFMALAVSRMRGGAVAK